MLVSTVQQQESTICIHISGEWNGNPLQYYCLENPMDRDAWQARIHCVTKELDTTEWLENNNNTSIYICIHMYIYNLILDPPSPSIPSLQVITEHWTELPVLKNSFPPAVYFTHDSVYMLMLLSQLVLPPPCRTVSMSPCSASASLFLAYKLAHQYHFSRFHIYLSIYLLSLYLYLCLYLYMLTWYMFFSFWLTSLPITNFRFVHITTNHSILFLFMAG